jgi:hypothetical protein
MEPMRGSDRVGIANNRKIVYGRIKWIKSSDFRALLPVLRWRTLRNRKKITVKREMTLTEWMLIRSKRESITRVEE